MGRSGGGLGAKWRRAWGEVEASLGRSGGELGAKWRRAWGEVEAGLGRSGGWLGGAGLRAEGGCLGGGRKLLEGGRRLLEGGRRLLEGGRRLLVGGRRLLEGGRRLLRGEGCLGRRLLGAKAAWGEGCLGRRPGQGPGRRHDRRLGRLVVAPRRAKTIPPPLKPLDGNLRVLNNREEQARLAAIARRCDRSSID